MAGSYALYTLLYLAIVLLSRRQVLATQYINDDSDYGDFDYYKDLPERRVGNAANHAPPPRDDFYVANGPESTEDRNRRVVSDDVEELPMSDGRMNSRERQFHSQQQSKWPASERVYRYTKHRIPGYDYEELDFLESRGQQQRCDSRSVYTHCLCQFTCAQPNVVDCYTPCSSGCECRENYVFDERAGKCVPPDQCQPEEDYLLY